MFSIEEIEELVAEQQEGFTKQQETSETTEEE